MHQPSGESQAAVSRTYPRAARAMTLDAAMLSAEPAICAAFAVRLRDAAPAFALAGDSALDPVLPQVLEQLAATIAGESMLRLNGSDDPVDASGYTNLERSGELDLDQVLLEYGLLRQVLMQELPLALGRDLSSAEASRLHEAIDHHSRRSAGRSAERQKDKLQADATAMAKYLSFLSHDLRGHLNGALLMIEVLRRDLQTDERFAESVADLDAMRQSMLELVGTMDRFLQAERLRQGRVEVSLQEIDLCSFLHEQRRSLTRQQRPGAEQIEVVCDPDLKVVTDREMLALIVQNLLGNCVKYSDGGMVGLRCYCPGASDGDGEVACRIEISDNGPGIPPALKDRLFVPFTRGSDTSRPGTGLGLFIAKQAADLLRATLHVDSEVGCGTIFTINLPVRQIGQVFEQPASS